MQNLRRLVIACLLGTTLLSCGGGGDGPPTAPVPVLTTLSVSLPTATIQVGQTSTATAAGLDQFGGAISTGSLTWSTASAAVATVNSSGVVRGEGAGQTQVIASAGNKQAQATVTVEALPVASVTVSPGTATIGTGGTQQLVATTFAANGGTLTGRVVTWGSSDESKATVGFTTGLVTGVAAGPATITATSEGRSGTSQITVSSQPSCSASNALQLTLGQIHTLTAAQTEALCLGGSASASEYVLIPFNSTNVAAASVQLRITGTNTSAILPGSQASPPPRASRPELRMRSLGTSSEFNFRQRERRDLASPFASFRQLPRDRRLPRNRQQSTRTSAGLSPSFITGLPADPVVGTTYQINANLSGNSCSAPKELRGAVVVAVLPRTIVLADETAPTGGWTAAEMAAFGQAFEDTGYPLAVAAFGAPSDIDANGRIAILYTPSVNRVPAGGLFASRDLFPVSTCAASNEGEMFYMPVPDVNNTINSTFSDKPTLARFNLSVLVHEFQHLINSGRRIYVNDASAFEEVWLNEGLSHIAEELLYYQVSGNTTDMNIDLNRLRSSQAQLDAVNGSQVGNLARLSDYMLSPETNSPFAMNNSGETRGAIWQLLRYAGDMRGGPQQQTWFSLVNSTTAGQANFNAVLGDIINLTRSWAVAQFTDDAGLGVPPNYTHPSWHFRDILPVLNEDAFPLLTRALTTVPVDIIVNGGGAAYVRFRVAAGTPATVAATSAGQPVPGAVEFILVRTQ